MMKKNKGVFQMNEVMKAMLTRRSVRKYKQDKVPREVLDQIMEAGTYAASAKNRQPWLILCVTNEAMLDRMSRLNAAVMNMKKEDYDPFFGAPAALVVLARKDVPTRAYDGSLMMGNLMLAAHAMGLGSCWVNRAYEVFESEEGKQILRELGVTEEYEGVGNCVLGYIDGEVREAAPRKECVVYVD